MAERRMFAKSIIDSDAFLDMPLSSQALYFHLGMRADDDGFVNSPKKIQRITGSSEDDLKLLIAKNFVIPFESGVVVLKHWKIHNYIQKDRYKETNYLEEKAQLYTKENKSYSLYPECIQNGYRVDTQTSIGKTSIGKCSSAVRSILSLMTPEETEKIFSLYTDADLLVDEIDEELNRKNKFGEILYPYRYVIGYATNKGWLTK